MKRGNILIAAGILIISLIVYFWLGGFSSLEYEIESLPEISVSGEEFTGRPTQKELEDLFYAYRDLARQADTCLIVVNYPKTEETASIRQFIGIPSSKTDTATMRSWPAGKFIRVVLEQNLIVTPKPENVQEQAEEFARTQGLELKGESIEIYRSDADPEVLYPVKED